MRRTFAGLLLLATSSSVLGFEAVDTIPYPSLGDFPAYPRAEAGPGRIYGQLGILRDDNVLRRPAGTSETVTRLGLGASYDARVYGRQRLRLEAQGDGFIYNRFSNLDHFAYGVLGEWRWEIGNQLSGTLGYERRHYQTDLAELRTARQEMITSNRLVGTAALRITPSWRVRGAAAAAETDRRGSSGSTSVTGGIDYVTGLGNSLGAEVRSTSGDAPLSEVLDPADVFRDNDYDQKELAAVATYNAGPQLRLGARVARTERTYTLLPSFDFEGTTYRFDAAWRPGNKTLLAFEVYKLPLPVLEVDATHVVTRGVAFGPSWAPTAKLVFSARIAREELEYPGDPAALGLTAIREEVVRALRLSAGWEATRRHHLGIAVDTGERSSNLLGRDYDYTAVMANLRYVF